MQRTIKFRAWCPEQKRMFDEDYFYLRYGSAWRIREFDEEVREREWVLMQFTGLLDKNGKEIYEGDIVRAYDEFGRVHRDYTVDHNDTEKHHQWKGWPSGCEVIGNIHQNPELLEAP